MSIENADYYRERPSGEIRKEQAELLALREDSYKKGEAWWEWDGYSYSFQVSSAWEKLTGYKATELFPSNLSRNIEIENLLDNYIRKWLKFVAPEDREAARDKAEAFLLENSTDNYFDHNYQFKFKDGEYRHILTTARSVWEDGRLMHLFVQTRVLNIDPSAIAAKSELNTEAIARIDAAAKQGKSIIDRIKSAIPIALAAMLAFGEAGGWTFIKEMKNNILFIFAPADVEQSNNLTGTSFDLDFLDDESLFHIKQAIQKNGVGLTRMSLGVYEPGIAPENYKIIMGFAGDRMEPLDWTAKSINGEGNGDRSEDIFISSRSEAHLNRQSYAPVGGPYSVPILIQPNVRRWQIFFVQGLSPSEDGSDRAQVEAAAADIQPIIEEAIRRDSEAKANEF